LKIGCIFHFRENQVIIQNISPPDALTCEVGQTASLQALLFEANPGVASRNGYALYHKRLPFSPESFNFNYQIFENIQT
jgi:hypothetical protein